jgi:hypothetical protein
VTHERLVSAPVEGLKLIADRNVTEAGDLATFRMSSGNKNCVPKGNADKGGANYRSLNGNLNCGLDGACVLEPYVVVIDRCLISGQVAEIGLLSPARSTL